jgi:TPR repeat protein
MAEHIEIKFNEDNLLELPLKEEKECVICLENIKTEYELCSVSCGHSFHAECMIKHEKISKNNKYNCPLCRSELDRPLFISYEATEIYKKQKTDKKVFSYLMDAAKQGDPVAACNLGMLYTNGDGCEQSYLLSCKWFCISAYKNVCQAQYNLGVCFRKHIIDYPKSIYWLKKASENNYTEASYTLGVMYNEGIITERNIDEAIKYYKLAANNGHALAQHNLSLIYIDEEYKDIKLHIYYLFLAANNNISISIHNKAYYYENGLNEDNCVIEKDIDMAIKLYRKSARMGNSYSQYSLALIYDNIYIEMFYELYFPYIVKMLMNSAEQNHEGAIETLDQLPTYEYNYKHNIK